jgi:NitT/TauT family transport system ATP-binding protein
VFIILYLTSNKYKLVYKIEKLYKKYSDNQLFADFDISFRENAISCILGPSGCGKTTLLHIICGLIHADGGELNGFNSSRISYIFQEPRLLPWKTVFENVELVLPDDLAISKKKEIVENYLAMVQLTGSASLYPKQLSGGMKQRVSIARAFAYKPDVILMDEPFKGLDLKLKNDLFDAFRNMWQTEPKTVIFVTHEPEEAIQLSDDIFVFSKNPVQIIEHISASHNKETTLLKQKLVGLLS